MQSNTSFSHVWPRPPSPTVCPLRAAVASAHLRITVTLCSTVARATTSDCTFALCNTTTKLTQQFSTTTTGSKVNLSESHTLISRKDLRASIACFEDVSGSLEVICTDVHQLMAAAKAYRNALLAMSSATAAFASAMEACSR